MDELNINELVVVTQLPKIMEQLDKLGMLVDEKLKGVDKLECTEENKKEVKEKRAEINNTLKILEEKRKEIKKAINEPYDLFNKKYEDVTKKKLENASNILKDKIDTIEDEQREKGIQNLKNYFSEYERFYHVLGVVKFEDLGLNITLTGLGKNLEGNKYKEEIKTKLEKIENDIRLIDMEKDYSEEIMLEYKKCFDYVQAKTIVIERHKEMEAIQKQKEEITPVIEQEKQLEQKVEEVIAPKEIIEDNEVISVTFTVTGTKEKIKELKNKIIELELDYE